MCPYVCDAPQAPEQLTFRTIGGTDVRVGRIAPSGAGAPGRRISLQIGHSPGGADGARAALTPHQARHLAATLLQQAAAAEGGIADVTAGQVEVSYLGRESYSVATRGHTLLTDQPSTAGGADAAMTPTELFVASLSSCVAFYAGRYLARHGLNRDGLHVSAEFALATDRPAQVGGVRLKIRVPGPIPPGREAALLAVASHCTVHDTLRHAPDITIDLA